MICYKKEDLEIMCCCFINMVFGVMVVVGGVSLFSILGGVNFVFCLIFVKVLFMKGDILVYVEGFNSGQFVIVVDFSDKIICVWFQGKDFKIGDMVM